MSSSFNPASSMSSQCFIAKPNPESAVKFFCLSFAAGGDYYNYCHYYYYYYYYHSPLQEAFSSWMKRDKAMGVPVLEGAKRLENGKIMYQLQRMHPQDVEANRACLLAGGTWHRELRKQLDASGQF